MEDRWIKLAQRQKNQLKIQQILAKFERLKDIDPRGCLRYFHEGDWIKGLFNLTKIMGKEMLYEVYRHTLGASRILDRPIFIT